MKNSDSKMHIWVDAPTTKVLRELAKAMRVFVRRGPGAHEVGNVAGLFQQVAQAWQAAPENVLALLTMVQQMTTPGAGAIRPWVNEGCGHCWLGSQDCLPDACQVCGDRSGAIHAFVDPRQEQPYEGETAWTQSANGVLERGPGSDAS